MNLQKALSEPFWVNHKIGDRYALVNRNKTVEMCEVVYYPLDDYQDFKALVEIKGKGFSDFREVPIRFLSKSQMKG